MTVTLMRMEKDKMQESVETHMKMNENLKLEVNKKKDIAEVQYKTLQTLEESKREADEYKVQTDRKLNQLQAEMILNQKNFQENLSQMKLRDKTITKLQIQIRDIKAQAHQRK